MKSKMEVIAIIPARGGSKGILRKNIVDLCGVPLIAYTILAAKNAQYIDRVVVSTEDDEIADISMRYGAEVPFLRPLEYAKDQSNLGDALKYTISKLGGYVEGKAYVQLFPTSPFRTSSFLDEMVTLLFNGYTSVSTVKEINKDPNLIFIKDQKGFVKISDNREEPSWKSYFRSYPLFIGTTVQKREKHYLKVIEDKCMLIDIDTHADLAFASKIISQNIYKFDF